MEIYSNCSACINPAIKHGVIYKKDIYGVKYLIINYTTVTSDGNYDNFIYLSTNSSPIQLDSDYNGVEDSKGNKTILVDLRYNSKMSGILNATFNYAYGNLSTIYLYLNTTLINQFNLSNLSTTSSHSSPWYVGFVIGDNAGIRIQDFQVIYENSLNISMNTSTSYFNNSLDTSGIAQLDTVLLNNQLKCLCQ